MSSQPEAPSDLSNEAIEKLLREDVFSFPRDPAQTYIFSRNQAVKTLVQFLDYKRYALPDQQSDLEPVNDKVEGSALGLPSGVVQSDGSAFEIGLAYFVRTATYHGTGRLVAAYPNELVFADAAWIAESGRFSEALKTGKYNEVEPFHNVWIVSRFAIVDATPIDTILPRHPI